MIHSVGALFVISSGGTWLPGRYATRGAASLAFCIGDAQLQAIHDRKSAAHSNDGAITIDDLREAMTSRKEAK